MLQNIANASGGWAIVLSVIYILTILMSFAVIFLERKSSSATLAWILVLYTLPGFGVLLYILLSQNISRQRIYRQSEHEQAKANESLQDQMDDMNSGNFSYVNAESAGWRQLIRQNQSYAGSYFTQDNDVEIFTHGSRMFKVFCEDLRRAKVSIHLESFILKPDETGLEILEILTEKARQGVSVRLLLDAIGSGKLKKRHLREFVRAGGQTARFFDTRIFRFNWRVNYRNHRKITIIDSCIGYIGGLNIADEYRGITKRFGDWRDTHARLRGGCVEDLDARFLMDWRLASGENYSVNPKYYREHEEAGDAGVQIVASGPDSEREEIKMAYLKMISNARRRVYVQTPYFIPDGSVFEALRSVALSGVDVRLMIPSMPDHPFVYWVTYSNAAELMKAGVKVYIYKKGFLHCKTLVVDGEVSSVGSANFDLRSFKLNFECNAFIYDKENADQMEKAFEADMFDSVRLTPEIYSQRSTWIKIKESISRLISDIL